MRSPSDPSGPPPLGGGASGSGGDLDFNWCLEFFEKRGKEEFGDHFFKIVPEDHDLIFNLTIYFLGDKAQCEKLGLDVTKGILLSGPMGAGKTSLISLMKYVPPPERNFVMKTTREVSFEFIREGYEVIDRYSRMSFRDQHPRIYWRLRVM